MYKRSYYKGILDRLNEPRRFIQVIRGPRQVGKTFLIEQVLNDLSRPHHYASADEPTIHDRLWIEQQWEIGRIRARESEWAILVLDEIHKVEGWSETVKRLWDSDTSSKLPLHVVILGSSPLMIQKGLTESLAGRFEIFRLPHWSYTEMRDAFSWSIEKYIFFGGYPGAAALIDDQDRWRRYINDALVETSISKDILLLKRVDKPALLRRLFYLGCEYSGQILSYQKMLGHLQDAGNTTTLAHYLELLEGAGLMCGLDKYSKQMVRARGSSPKLLALNNALISAVTGLSFGEAQENRDYWGRLVESAVGAHIFNSMRDEKPLISYWRERDKEVDYVITSGKRVVAIEVKSGRRRSGMPGMEIFKKNFKPQRILLVGGDGISLEEFLSSPPKKWFEE